MMEMQITMIRPAEDFGPVLTGRSAAAGLRQRIEVEAMEGDGVVIDFEGVEAVSPSFADELFAKLPTEFSDRVRFENVGSDLAALMRFVISGRH
jgi:hypothetical protein